MSATQTPPEPAAPQASLLRQPATYIALVALAAALLLWFVDSNRINTLQNDLARRLGEGDAIASESRTDSHQAKEDVQALTARVSLLEARLNEAQGQQAALETMYQEFARSRDERLLAEIEQSVAIAAQQLQLAGNVEAALIALQGADARLAQNGNVQFANLRHMIERDIDHLKALPQADVSGMAVKLENVTALVDDLPLAYTQRPPRNQGAGQGTDKAQRPSPVESAWWKDVFIDAWGQIRQLIRIERMDRDAPALMAPSQAVFLRENLRLRLVNARLSLLQRDSQSFRDDVGLAAKWLALYFDMSDSDVKLSYDTLQKLAGTNLNLTLPTLDDTLATLRTLRASLEKK